MIGSTVLRAGLAAVLGCLCASHAFSSEMVAPPCGAPEFRQFDFWVGNWEVRDSKGQVVGRNLVERTLGDCVVQEHWVGKRGLHGSSFNIYSPAAKRWHQTWVDDHGMLLQLDGEFRNGRMVLSGKVPSGTDPAKSTLQRISWEKQEDGRVRQLWETSSDGGATWTVAFDGWYSRVAESPTGGAPADTLRR